MFGQRFIALNAVPSFTFSQGISLFVACDSQDEIDRYWTGLTNDGGKEAMGGWLRDEFGVSWQIVPRVLGQMLGDIDSVKSKRAMDAMMTMKKLDIGGLERAFRSE